MRHLYILLTALVLSPISLFSQDESRVPVITAKLSPDTIMIGDRFFIDITIEKDMLQIVEFPEYENNKMNEVMEIISTSPIDTLEKDGRRLKLFRRYELTSFDEGAYSLERFPMLYADKNVVDTIFSTDEMNLFVNTFEIDTLKHQIVDIKKPIDTPITFAEIKDKLLWGLLIAALVALAIYLYLKYRKNKRVQEDTRPSEPFYITALRMLESLKAKDLCAKGDYKAHYTCLTDIVREYMEYRYQIAAMEMTSDEALAAAKKAKISGEDLELLATLFEISDLVKFAKATPSQDDNAASFNAAYRFIDRTKPMPMEQAEGESEQTNDVEKS